MNARTCEHGPKGKGNDLRTSQICKSVQVVGFYCLALGFFLLGPFKSGESDLTAQLDKPWIMWLAMCLKGVGSSGNNAGYVVRVLVLSACSLDSYIHTPECVCVCIYIYICTHTPEKTSIDKVLMID